MSSNVSKIPSKEPPTKQTQPAYIFMDLVNLEHGFIGTAQDENGNPLIAWGFEQASQMVDIIAQQTGKYLSIIELKPTLVGSI